LRLPLLGWPLLLLLLMLLLLAWCPGAGDSNAQSRVPGEVA
jgi:hypothetical protein